jgi:hypothetical protein
MGVLTNRHENGNLCCLAGNVGNYVPNDTRGRNNVKALSLRQIYRFYMPFLGVVVVVVVRR